MRMVITLVAVLGIGVQASAQEKEVRRLDVRLNSELYPQAKAKDTLQSLIRALDKERYDYILAHLLDPAFVDDQLRISAPFYERLAADKVNKEDLLRKGFPPEFIAARKRDLALQANIEHLVRRIRAKLENDPEAVKELRKMAREGDFMEGGETATAKHKDIKEHTVYFKKIDDRWYIENKMTE